MKNTLFIFMLLASVATFAQKEKSPSNLYLSAAANYNYRNYTNALYSPKFSPALSLLIRSQPNRMWEIGFSQLYFGKINTKNTTVYNLLLGINVAHTWLFLTENHFPIKPTLGAGVFTYLSNYDYQPKISLTYPQLRQAWGMELAITPGLLYEYKEKWLFSLSNPIGLGDFALVKTKYEDPTLAIRKRRNMFFDFSSNIGFMGLKIGVARKI